MRLAWADRRLALLGGRGDPGSELKRRRGYTNPGALSIPLTLAMALAQAQSSGAAAR